MKILGKLKEKHLLRKLQKGDEGAFIELYDQYAPQIYRFVYLKTNSRQDSEDLTSEVFLRCWRTFQQGTVLEGQSLKDCPSRTVPCSNPRALLYQIARNLVVDYYRKKPKADLILDEEKEAMMENIPSQDPDLGQKVAVEGDLAQIQKALSQLKEEHQDLILWHYLDDFSVKEIAQILERSEGTVRVQLHRALKSLQGKLK